MIAILEQAITSRLIDMRNQKGLKIHIDTASAPPDANRITEQARRAPAIYVSFADMARTRARRPGAHSFEGSFVLTIIGKSASHQQARIGGRGGMIIGALELIEFAYFAITDLCHPLLERDLRPENVRNLVPAMTGHEDIAAYSLTLSCEFTMPVWNADEYDDLETIHHQSSIGDGAPVMETDLRQDQENPA